MAIKYLDAKRLQGTNAERLAISPFTLTQSSANDGRDLQEEIAMRFNAGHELVDQKINSVTWYIKKQAGTTGGTLRAWIRESDGTEVAESPTTFPATGLDTSDYEARTFTFPATTLDVTEMLTISCADVSGSQPVLHTQMSPMTDAEMYRTTSIGESYLPVQTDGVTDQAKMIVEYGDELNLPNGTIFNETDAFKYFMWNGTDTWNQMVSS